LTIRGPTWRNWPASGGVTGVAEPPEAWTGNPASRWDEQESENAEPQPLYMMMMRLTNSGQRMMGSFPMRLLEINHEVEQHACEIVAQFALLGGWDFVSVIRAKDNLTIHAIARDLAAHGDLETQTLPAIPLEEFVETMKKAWPPRRPE